MDIEVSKVRRRLAGHPVYQSLSSVEDLRFFMERHVVAVWDFMSLLKSLQSELTTVTWPWHPPRDPNAARLVNEIVLGEESDEIADGVFRSHFEWYLDAMDEVGADRGPIDRFVAALTAGQPWKDALASSRLPGEAQTFVKSTMKLAGGPLHVRASAFFYGREDLIPDMFIKLVAHLRKEGHPCETLNAYLERHIEVDGGEHGPMARRLLETLTGDNSKRRAEVEKAAITALRARDRLWSAIDEGL
ncbi:MAG: DUF3050 domain-containing protein, partial [Myxococcota bacterium]